jgi:hypothetical protein
MIGTGAHIATHTIERTCRELGVEPPPGYVEGLAAGEQLRTNLKGFSNRNTGGDLLDTVFASVAANRHPADDEAVRRLLVMAQLEGYELHRQADERAKQLTGDTVCLYADELIGLWAKATAKDGKVLWETAQSATFADVADLDGMHPSQLVDVEAHRRWVASATASRRLNAAAAGFTSMLTATRLGYPTGYATLALAPQLGLDDLTEINRSVEHGRRPSAWDIARHGVVPTLAGSLSDFAAAVGGVQAEQSARAQAATPAATVTAVAF